MGTSDLGNLIRRVPQLAFAVEDMMEWHEILSTAITIVDEIVADLCPFVEKCCIELGRIEALVAVDAPGSPSAVACYDRLS